VGSNIAEQGPLAPHSMPAIAAAAIADAASILALQSRAYESEARLYDDWTIPPLVQSLESLLEEIQSATVLKATEAQVIVGSVRATLNDKTCQIGRLIVEPMLHGQGIGSLLLQAIEGAFSQAEFFELFTGSKSEGNIRLYRRHGYRITGTKRLSDQVTFVVMSKRGNTGA